MADNLTKIERECERVTSPFSFVQREHALVSPSSLKRIVACTKSLKINEDYRLEHGEESTAAALEGTKAHAVAENLVNQYFNLPLQEDSVKEAEDADYAMKACGAAYRDFVVRLFNGGDYKVIKTERKVDMQKYITECWGTCDCFLVSKDTITIVDYKYGKALVNAKNNTQLKAYALGAYLSLPDKLKPFIKKASFFIFQPRATTDYSDGHPRKLDTVGAISHDEISVVDLISWAQEVNKKVELAIRNEGNFETGEHCAFCAGNGTCPLTRQIDEEELEIYLQVLSM